MNRIHRLAYVDPKAELGADVEVGPFCYVGPGVRLGQGCRLHPHATLLGPSTFGCGNQFYSHCVIGAAPQDLKYRGGPTELVVGDDNIFRENTTVHRGTESDRHSGGLTRIGDRNLFMCGVHVAHDSAIGNHVILANNVLLAGHVRVEDCVNIGGGTAVHHLVTIGRNAFIGGVSRVTQDVPPYLTMDGYDQVLRGVNVEGLRRWQFSPESIEALKAAFRLIFPRENGRVAGRTAEAISEIEQNGLSRDEHVRYLIDFLKRKLTVGKHGRWREALRTDRPADRGAFYLHQNPDRKAGAQKAETT